MLKKNAFYHYVVLFMFPAIIYNSYLLKKIGYIIKVLKGFIDRLDVNFDILVIFVSLFLCTGTVFFAARIGCTFGCH